MKKTIIFFAVSLLLVTGIAPSSLAFSDTNDHSNEYAINFVKTEGIVEGYTDGTFKPNNPINRAEFTKIVMEAMYPGVSNGTSCFPDVVNDWYAKYVCQAKSLSIISGYPDGYFRPSDEVNLAEALKIIFEAYEFDINYNYSIWYESYFWFAKPNGLLENINEDISHSLTRGEMAQLIYNTEQFVAKESKSPYENDVSNVEFLILTDPTLVSKAEEIADMRSSEGLVTMIKNIDELELNAQETTVDWVRTFKSIHPQLHYLLLFGDSNNIPTYYSDNPRADEVTATDAPYRLADNNQVSQLAVGRIPVRSLEEADNFIYKLKKYNSYTPETEIYLFGDSAEFDYYAMDHADYTKSIGFTSLAERALNESYIANEVNSGNKFSIYYGHGSYLGLYGSVGAESFWHLFYKSDIKLLTNKDKPTIFFSGGCDTANYDTEDTTIAEALLLEEHGAVASIGATRKGGYGYDYEFVPSFFDNCSNSRIGDAFNQALFENHEIVMNFTEETWTTQQANQEDWSNFFFETMSLLGDPTMIVCDSN